MNALPSTYRSDPVIPYAPNRAGDRPHEWDWGKLDVSSNAAGLTTVASRIPQGAETITLGYEGLTRAEARTLEQFFVDRAGRFAGFWCPTFQHDFYAIARTVTSTWPGGALGIREWGYTAAIQPLGFAYRQFAGYRPGVIGGSWYLGEWAPNGVTVTEDGTTNILTGYDLTPSGAGNVSVIGNDNSQGANTGLVLMRMLWCHFADDGITTEWTHPNFATITLRAATDYLNAPG